MQGKTRNILDGDSLDKKICTQPASALRSQDKWKLKFRQTVHYPITSCSKICRGAKRFNRHFGSILPALCNIPRDAEPDMVCPQDLSC